MAQTFPGKAWFSPVNVPRTAHPHVPCAQPVSRPGIKTALQATPQGLGELSDHRRFNKPVTPQEGLGPGWGSLATLAVAQHPPSFSAGP